MFESLVPLVDVAAGESVPISCQALVSVSAPMQSEEQLQTCNLLSVRVDGVFNVPEQWPVVQQGKPNLLTSTITPDSVQDRLHQ